MHSHRTIILRRIWLVLGPWSILLPSPHNVRDSVAQGRPDLHLHAEDAAERDNCHDVRAEGADHHLRGRPLYQREACLLWRLHLLRAHHDLDSWLSRHQAIFTPAVHSSALGFLPRSSLWRHLPSPRKGPLYD